MEQRKHFRLNLNLPLNIELIPENKPISRISSNISAGGMFFHGQEEDNFHAGQRFKVTMSAPPVSGKSVGNHSISGEGKVLRVENTMSEGVSLVACKFDKPLRFENC